MGDETMKLWKDSFANAGNHLLAVIPTLFSSEGVAFGAGFAGFAYLKGLVNPMVNDALPAGKAGSGLWAVYQGALKVVEFKYGMGLKPAPVAPKFL